MLLQSLVVNVPVDYVYTMSLQLGDIPNTIEEIKELDYDEATKWIEALEEELYQLEDKGVMNFNLSQREKDGIDAGRINAVDYRIILNKKLNNSGDIEYKCRLVARGFKQIQGLDYDKVYAPTLQKSNIKLLLNLTAILDWHISLADVGGAFPEADLDRIIYGKLTMWNGDGYNTYYCKMDKALYGLKQAARQWYLRMKDIMMIIGMETIISDDCIFIERDEDGNIILIVAVHVDDMLAISETTDIGEDFISRFEQHVNKLKRINNFTKYLGIEINQDTNEENDQDYQLIYLHQQSYISETLSKFTPQGDGIVSTPILSGDVSCYHSPFDKLSVKLKVKLLQEVSGTLQFLANTTRPDLSATTGILAQSSTKPYVGIIKHYNHLLKYIRATKNFKIRYSGKHKKIKLFGYADASYTMKGDSKGRTGIALFLNLESAAIDAYSKKQTNVSHSAMESEIIAIDTAIKRIVVFRELLRELGYEQQEPTVLFVDSDSGRDLCYSWKIGDRARHINPMVNYIREQINKRVVELVFIDTKYNVADILTKTHIPVKTIQYHTQRLLNGITQEEFDFLMNRKVARIYKNKPNKTFNDDNVMYTIEEFMYDDVIDNDYNMDKRPKLAHSYNQLRESDKIYAI
jgi:uncharacterized protein YuzE